ncbi:hypothetical protein [Sulfitobacter donghicola]|nr:hypothetical protein [Sulfitobacter donghicola]
MAIQTSKGIGAPSSISRLFTKITAVRNKIAQLDLMTLTKTMEAQGFWFRSQGHETILHFNCLNYEPRNDFIDAFRANCRWQGLTFQSVEEIFSPALNTGYAANSLHELHPRFRDWAVPAGSKLSRAQKQTSLSKAGFQRVLGSLVSVDLQPHYPQTKNDPTGARVSTFSLFQGTKSKFNLGVLIPETRPSGSLSSSKKKN